MDRSRQALARMRAVGPPAILVSATIVAVIVGAEVRGLVISGAARTIASGAVGMAAPHLEFDETGGIAITDEQALDAEVRQRMKVNQVVAYRLYDVDGTLLYSAVAAPAEAGGVHSDAFSTAAGGEVSAELVDHGDDPVVPEDAGTLMRVYAPIGSGGEGGPTIAVADIYKPYAPVSASVRDAVLAVWLVIGLGAVITAGSLGFVAQRANRQIAESDQQVASLNGRLQLSLLDLEEQSLGVLQSLASAVDAKDSYTARHALGVTDTAHRLGEALGLSPEELTVLERASLLHDIGKIGVSEAILLKPGALTAEEFDHIKEHPEMGAKILETIPFLADVVPAVRYHHERWDGTGYPGVLEGEAIPLLARILAVADTFDAMTTTRPYRSAASAAEALLEIRMCSGTQFDPAMADAFVAMMAGSEAPTA